MVLSSMASDQALLQRIRQAIELYCRMCSYLPRISGLSIKRIIRGDGPRSERCVVEFSTMALRKYIHIELRRF